MGKNETVVSSNLDFLIKNVECSLPSKSKDVKLNQIYKLEHQGAASVVYSFTLSYVSEGLKQHKTFLLKIFRNNKTDEGLREYLVLKSFRKFNFQAPIAYHFGTNNKLFGKAYLIMERIIGNNGSKYMHNEANSINFVDKMAENLTQLHRLDYTCFYNSKELQERFNNHQYTLFNVKFFIKNRCKTFQGFLPLPQKRFLKAVKQLEERNLKKFHPALLHMDYQPNHVIVSNKEYFLTDWGNAGVGDPAFDVALTYHILKFGRENSKMDLGEHFVDCYKKYANQTLPNLEVYKELTAIGLAIWAGLSPFKTKNKFLNYGKLVELTLGHLFGRVINWRFLRNKEKLMATHHTSILSNIEYLRNYSVTYLENTLLHTN